MASISKEKIYLRGIEWMKHITYSKGEFRLKLPDIMCKDLNLTSQKDIEITGSSEYEVNKLFKEKMNEWEKAIEIITKVIIFRPRFQGALARKSFKSRWEKGYEPSYQQNGISTDADLWEFNERDLDPFGTSLGMTIQWAIYEKKDVKGKISYKALKGRPFDYHRLNGNLGNDYTEIEWTQPREDFFMQLDESFATMIAKIHSALGDLTPEKLILLTEKGLNLLTQ